jgi:hypothetical protein
MTPPTGLYRPYREPSTNFLYNLLFCDDLALFLSAQPPPPDSPLHLIQAATDLNAIAALATDTTQESRVRALAYTLLRQKGWQIPPKLLLGVIFEVPLEHGLDTLAVFSDHRIRYINQTGKILVMETAPPNLLAKATEVLAAAQQIVNQIGPWDKTRLPPPTPKEADIRMTFLVSDGLYFGQGGFQNLERDPMSAPLIRSSGQFLNMVVDTALGTK